ncbi:hypothetical protein FBALC1_08268 [Flavobacteriales bacterium ALC-1]|nr:hypothetical protein FBALC1_08268 [Flavobacteriales bacterium ALC-1]
MKKATKLILALLISTFSFAQKSEVKIKYYKNEKNQIYSELEYINLKKKIVSEFKKINQTVKVEEIFTEIEKKGDSIIQNYTIKVIPLLINGQVKEGGNRPALRNELINKKLPETTLKSIDGSDLNTNDLKGKPTMINFWFTNCAPCIDEFPVLNKLREKYSDKVNFISITFDNKDKVEKLANKYQFDFEKYIDAKKYIEKLNIGAYPTSLFIDKNGIVKYAEGGVPYIHRNGKRSIGDGKEFENIIKELLD